MNGFLSDLIGGAAGYLNAEEAIKDLRKLGETSQQQALDLGEDIYGRAQFQPFTVTTSLGGATTTPTGGFGLELSPEQQALQNQLLSQATGLFGQVGVDPSVAQADLYEQIRATQRPEEERQRLALEERMLSQGRLGLQSSAYGGSSPELLAQETARQEAMARASLGARTQAMAEQKQALDAATGMMTQGYIPQEQALAALGYGIQGGQLADVGRRTGAELFGKLGQSGLEARINLEELATGLEASQRDALANVFLGSQPTIQQQIAATQAGMTPQQIQNLGGSGIVGTGLNWLSNQLGIGTPSTPSTPSTPTLSLPQLPTTSIGQSIPSGVNNIGSYLQGLSSSATGSMVGGMLSTPIVPPPSGGTTGGSGLTLPTLPSYSLGQYSTGTPIII
jgi:hypothetical protein